MGGAVNVAAGDAPGQNADPAKGRRGETQAQKDEAKKNQDDNKKKKCDKKVSKSEKDKLRPKSPSDANRAQVQKQKKCYSCQEAVKDGLVRGKKMEADHIVPFSKIIDKPGFACLDDKNKLAILNDPRNIVGLCRNCNGSKCSRLWNEWKGHSEHGFKKNAESAGKNLGARRDELLNQAIAKLPWNT